MMPLVTQSPNGYLNNQNQQQSKIFWKCVNKRTEDQDKPESSQHAALGSPLAAVESPKTTQHKRSHCDQEKIHRVEEAAL